MTYELDLDDASLIENVEFNKPARRIAGKTRTINTSSHDFKIIANRTTFYAAFHNRIIKSNATR